MTVQTDINHTERAHARLSASKIPRVLLCHGSLLAEEGMPPEPTNEAAARGTAIHEIAEHLLLGRSLPDDTPEDLIKVAQGYVKAVEQFTPNAKRKMVELSITEALQQIHPSLGGTADLVAIGGGELLVCDLKTGRIDVDPEHNPQLLTYALGAALALKAPSSVKVRLAIYQPDAGGWKEWACSYPDLMDWQDTLSEVAKLAHSPNAVRSPSTDACRYCRAKMTCPAIRDAAVSAAKVEFAVDKSKPLAAPEVTTAILDDAQLCVIWADSVQAAAKTQLVSRPDSIAGWRLKDGRKMQKWKDSKMAAAVLVGHPEAFTLKSPSAIAELGLELPVGLIEETRASASLAKVK